VEDQTTMRHERDPHKRITSPLILNFKILSLWVFLFIRYSTFLFILNAKLNSYLDFYQLSRHA